MVSCILMINTASWLYDHLNTRHYCPAYDNFLLFQANFEQSSENQTTVSVALIWNGF